MVLAVVGLGKELLDGVSLQYIYKCTYTSKLPNETKKRRNQGLDIYS